MYTYTLLHPGDYKDYYTHNYTNHPLAFIVSTLYLHILLHVLLHTLLHKTRSAMTRMFAGLVSLCMTSILLLHTLLHILPHRLLHKRSRTVSRDKDVCRHNVYYTDYYTDYCTDYYKDYNTVYYAEDHAPSAVTRMFAGLMSLCITFNACIALSPRSI